MSDFGGMSDSTTQQESVQPVAHYLKQEIYDLFRFDPVFFEIFQQEVLDGIWYWDLEDIENEWMNERFWHTLGYDPSEKKHLASEWQDIIFQEDLTLATDNFQRHLKDPSCPYDQYVRYRHKNGSTVWIRCRGIAIHNTEGQAIRFLGIHVDMTGIMQRQERLLKSNLKHNHLLKQQELLEHDIIKLRSENEMLSIQLKKIKSIDPVSGLATHSFFWQEASRLKSLANRLNQVLSVFTFSIDNSDTIINSVGEHELVTKTINLKEMAQTLILDSVATSFEESSVTLFSIGYNLFDLQLINENFIEMINDRSWSLITPQVSISFGSEMPRPSIDSQIEDLLVLSSQMRL